MSIFHAIVLGILQGLTEFIPISSDGHLTLGEYFFGLHDNNITFNVLLHLGTLGVVLFVYKDFWLELLKKLFTDDKIEALKFISYIVVANIPTAIIGLLMKKFLEPYFTNLILCGFGFLFTALVLYFGFKNNSLTTKNTNIKAANKELTYWKVFLVGIAQGIAVLPGVSRSGSTIGLATYLKISPTVASTFSFLLSVPAILGATLLEALDGPLESIMQPQMIVGLITSFIVGFIGLKLTLYFLSTNKIRYFSYYLFLIGLVTAAIGLIRA